MGPPHEVVEISSDDDEAGSGKWSVSPSTLGWITRLRDSLPPVPRNKKGRRGSVRVGDDGAAADDDCVILDGEPHSPVAAAAGAKGRSAVDAAADELEIVALKGEIACKDFPHSRHVCSEFPFGTTSHVKHCGMCYCFVCDAPAPCKYWGKGLPNDDHCHATDKEPKWKELRQSFKCKTLPAHYPEILTHVVYPTTLSPRQKEFYEGYIPEEYRGEDEGGYFEPDDEATVCVRNLHDEIDSEDLAELFKDAGIVLSSEIIYDRETCQSCGYGFVTMKTVQEAENAVELYHRVELYGRFVTVTMASATTSPTGSPLSSRRSSSSSFKIYVGNLPREVGGYELKKLFSGCGEVVHAKVLYNGKEARGRFRGFGFVTMATQEGIEDAIWDLNNEVWKGHKLRVRVAREEEGPR